MQQALRLTGNLVMTRLLAPDDFGLIAVVFAFHTGLLMATDVGIRRSVTRFEHGDDPTFLRTAWTLQALQYTGLGVFLALAALGLEVIGSWIDLGRGVFGDEKMPTLMMASVGILILQGLESMNLALAQRRMTIERVVKMEVAAQVTTLVATVGYALLFPNVWAFVFGATTAAVVRCGLSHVILPGPVMRPTWETRHAREIWHFGKWLIGASLAGFVARNGDKFVLGAFMTSKDFGLYSIATIWLFAALSTIESVINSIGQPAFNETIRRSGDLGRIFYKMRSGFIAISFAAFACILVFSEYVTIWIYPPEYAPVSDYLVLISVGIIFAHYRIFGQLFMSHGRTRYISDITLFMAACTLLSTLLTVALFGVEWAVVVAALRWVWQALPALWIGRRYVRIEIMKEMGFLALIVATATGLSSTVDLSLGSGRG